MPSSVQHTLDPSQLLTPSNSPPQWMTQVSTDYTFTDRNKNLVHLRFRPLNTSSWRSYPLTSFLPTSLQSLHSTKYFSCFFKDQFLLPSNTTLPKLIEDVERKENELVLNLKDHTAVTIRWATTIEAYSPEGNSISIPQIFLSEGRRAVLILTDAFVKKEPIIANLFHCDFVITADLFETYLQQKGQEELCVVIEDTKGEIQGTFLQGKIDSDGTLFQPIRTRPEYQEVFTLLEAPAKWFEYVAESHHIPLEKVAEQFAVGTSDHIQGLKSEHNTSVATEFVKDAGNLCKFKGMKMLVSDCTNPGSQRITRHLGYEEKLYDYQSFPFTKNIHFDRPMIKDGQPVQGLLAVHKFL